MQVLLELQGPEQRSGKLLMGVDGPSSLDEFQEDRRSVQKGTCYSGFSTEDTPEPTHSAPLDGAGLWIKDGGRLTACYTGREGRATWRADIPALATEAIGIVARLTPNIEEMAAFSRHVLPTVLKLGLNPSRPGQQPRATTEVIAIEMFKFNPARWRAIFRTETDDEGMPCWVSW